MARSISSPTPGMQSSEVSRDGSGAPAGGGGGGGGGGVPSSVDRDQVYTWILELINPDTREHALIELRCVGVANLLVGVAVCIWNNVSKSLHIFE